MDIDPRVMNLAGTPGITRTDLYRRFVLAAHEVLERDIIQEEQPAEMATKVDIQEALNRLVSCPVCGDALMFYDEYPQERSCNCGDFTVSGVWTNGDVEYTFKMVAATDEDE